MSLILEAAECLVGAVDIWSPKSLSIAVSNLRDGVQSKPTKPPKTWVETRKPNNNILAGQPI